MAPHTHAGVSAAPLRAVHCAWQCVGPTGRSSTAWSSRQAPFLRTTGSPPIRPEKFRRDRNLASYTTKDIDVRIFSNGSVVSNISLSSGGKLSSFGIYDNREEEIHFSVPVYLCNRTDS